MINIKNVAAQLSVVLFSGLLVSSCTTISELAGIKDPEFEVNNVRLSNISFEQADLLMDINIHNPNNFTLKLAGFDYNLAIEKASFLKGKQDYKQTIKAKGDSNFKLPISLNYKDVYKAFEALAEKDEINYDVWLDFYFNLPVIGKTSFPTVEKGVLPLPKIPVIEFDEFKLDNLSFSGADLKLELIVENPNSFDMVMNKFNYDLNIDGKSWAKTVSAEKKKFLKKGKCKLSIPVSLDFLTMGRTVYKSLTAKKPLEYNFSGEMDLKTSIPIMEHLVLPINQSGKINISK